MMIASVILQALGCMSTMTPIKQNHIDMTFKYICFPSRKKIRIIRCVLILQLSGLISISGLTQVFLSHGITFGLASGISYVPSKSHKLSSACALIFFTTFN